MDIQNERWNKKLAGKHGLSLALRGVIKFAPKIQVCNSIAAEHGSESCLVIMVQQVGALFVLFHWCSHGQHSS